MDQQRIEIVLRRSQDDAREDDSTFQEELSEFSKSLCAAGLPFSQRGMAFDSIDAHGYALAEFAVKTLAPAVIPAVTALCGAWVQARYGRKVRLKIGNVVAEGRTNEEIKKMLEQASDFLSQRGLLSQSAVPPETDPKKEKQL